jgi:hypothetical protein
MKILKDQFEKIKNINERVKDLDPMLKMKIIDYELYKLLGEDYLKIASKDFGHVASKYEPSKELRELTEPVSEKFAQEKGIPSIREFYNSKQPTSESEKVAVFGFYLEHYKGISEFGRDDISQCYYDVRVRKPKVVSQALRDAKNIKGFLVGGKKPGRFRLSTTGENLVLYDLPRGKKS